MVMISSHVYNGSGAPALLQVHRKPVLTLILLIGHICSFKCFAFVTVQTQTTPTPTQLHVATPVSSSDSMAGSEKEPNAIIERHVSRRKVLVGLGGFLSIGYRSHSRAEEISGDMTSELFNIDGSLKDGIESQARFQKVEFEWAASSPLDSYLVNIDGIDTTRTASGRTSPDGGTVKLSYDLPSKWKGPSGQGDANKQQDLYTDFTVKKEDGEVVKALTSITVYESPGLVEEGRLEKATSTGIAKSLNILPSLAPLQSADLIGGRVRTLGESQNQKMYDFDLAVAPKICPSDSKDNLGLGFCPFDTIYLLSATIVNERLYVFALQCDRDQWKRSSSDLKKVRSSFKVQQ
ncbi:hypothetical protein ACA910_001696 [Epithemia clementina (nom. ined.)]